MKRREFITLLGGTAATWSLAARAQQPERVRRIGVLLVTNESDPEQEDAKEAFVHGLQKFAWTAGTNVMIDYRWGGGDPDRIRLYAAEPAGMQPDVIWTTGGLSLLALKRATHIIPIVFTSIYDPVGSGFVASLTRPDGNSTGFTAGEFSMGGNGWRFSVTSGGLVSYGVDRVEQSRQAAGYVDRILRGERPADLPVQQITKIELIINLKTAKMLGLTVSLPLLGRADEVIE